MYAVFKLSGHQFNAEEGAVIEVPFQEAEPGAKIKIDEVLLIKDQDTTLVGDPFVEGARIEAELLSSGLGDKVRIYKAKRRTKYRRTQGHRQKQSEIKITKIVAPQK